MIPMDAVSAKTGRKRGANAEAAAALLRARLFRAARRHTLIVRTLRVLLPLFMLFGFGVYGLLLTNAFNISAAARLSYGKIEVTASDLKMKNPVYQGITSDRGKYEVRAREAAVDFAMTGPIKLETIDGELMQANGVKTILKATRGAFDNKKGELELFDGIDVDATNGMRAQLDRALVYTKDHRVVSRDPIRAEMPTGTLTANSMDFLTDKRIGKFRGNVNLRLVQTPASTGARPAIGLGNDARQPVTIQSQEFDIDDFKSLADFRGAVVARQGETQLTAPELHITYEGQATRQAGLDTGQPPVATPDGASSGAQLSRLVARNGVTLTAGVDRRVVSDSVDFDVKADTALFLGSVELQQAKNVFRGGRLSVDRKAGKSRLDTPPTTAKAPPGRIAATLVQQSDPAKPAAAPKAKTAQSADATNPLASFNSAPGSPTDIEADTLDVNDIAKQAVFRGRVVAKQNGNVITASEMVAHYSGQTGMLSSAPGDAKSANGTQLTQIETRGGTKIVSKDGQEAEGASSHFDIKTNQVVLEGSNGVSLRQGADSVIKGCRVRMNMGTGEARIETCSAVPESVPPTPAQLSINAKAGVAPPIQPTDCPPGRACIVLMRPDQLQKSTDGHAKSAPASPATKSNTPPPQPQTSPSAVYRSN